MRKDDRLTNSIDPNGFERSAQKARITLTDIAKAAGVSRATVSLVLRDSPSIPRRTKEHVLQHAERLGYVYNRGAASLRTAKTNIVGLVIHDITNPYFAEIAAAIQRELAKYGRVAFLGDTGDSPDRQQAFIDTIREYFVDGIIMSPAAGTDPKWMAKLRDWRLPCVMVSRSLPDVPIDYVGGDNVGGMREATSHLISLGHRHIAMIGVNESISTGRERLQGYLQALRSAGLEVRTDLIVTCPATREAAHKALIRLLRLPQPPTAAVCFNDVTAFGVMLALQNLGLEVGKDFSVVGYDDVAEAVLWKPSLTTQRVEVELIGQRAVSLLIRRIQDWTAPVENLVIPPSFQIRETTAKPLSRREAKKLRNAANTWSRFPL